jgi:transposase-like protein
MKGRIFTPEFKLSVVRAVLSGEKSVVQLCREHNLSDRCIHNWKKLYRQKGEAAFTAPTIARSGSATVPLSEEEQELAALRNKVAELERFIGQQAVEISILKKVPAALSSMSKNAAK